MDTIVLSNTVSFIDSAVLITCASLTRNRYKYMRGYKSLQYHYGSEISAFTGCVREFDGAHYLAR